MVQLESMPSPIDADVPRGMGGLASGQSGQVSIIQVKFVGSLPCVPEVFPAWFLVWSSLYCGL